MTRFAITTAITLLGFAGLAGGAFAKAAQAAPLQANATITQSQPNHSAPSMASLGHLRIIAPSRMKNDFVYIDGGDLGRAGNLKAVPLAPGTHELMLRSPYGATDYWRDVGIGAGQVTAVHAFPTENTVWNASGYLSPSAPYLPPPAASPRSTGDSGDLDLQAPAAMNRDAVFVDGVYFGRAQKVRMLPLAPGMHHLALYEVNGIADYQQNVDIALGHNTDVRPMANVLAEGD